MGLPKGLKKIQSRWCSEITQKKTIGGDMNDKFNHT